MKIGDFVKIDTKNKVYKGVLMPSHTKNIIIKLDSGYNLGISKKNIKSMKTISKKGSLPKKKAKLKYNKKLPTVMILHTGGTVASEVDYETGAVSPQFTPEELVFKYPEIQNIANIKAKLISNVLSENIRYYHFNKLAQEIKKNYNKVDGFIITHGTDVLHYTSTALAFMLENLGKPVILIGAQRSSDRPSTDAFLNLFCATKFIAKTDFAGVAICMHSSKSDDECAILSPTKTQKLHTSRRDAFQPVNSKPIALISKEKIKVLSKHKQRSKEKLTIKPFKQNIKIAFLKTHPHMYASEILALKKYNGVVIEATGLGHIPVVHSSPKTLESAKILKALKQLSKKIPVVITSQCLFGRINLNVYTGGILMKTTGVLGNYTDMLPSTAFIKLAWLLSNHKKNVRNLISENLRGEISSRIKNEFI